MSPSPFRAEPATRAVCAIAALASLGLLAGRLSGLHVSDLPVLILLVAPYGLLAVMAAGVRRRRADAWTLLITTVLLALGGIALLAFQSPHPFTGPEPGLALSVIVIALPLLQLVVVALLGLGLLLRRLL
jgi:hypothetical protein